MSNSKRTTSTNPATAAAQPMMEWWSHQWFQGAHPMARLQLAWMESIAETMQLEAQFLMALAESGEKMAQCFSADDGPATPAEVQECYQKMVKDVTDAHMQRMGKVADLSHDFRQRIWEEL